jgi:hypothetical protein
MPDLTKSKIELHEGHRPRVVIVTPLGERIGILTSLRTHWPIGCGPIEISIERQEPTNQAPAVEAESPEVEISKEMVAAGLRVLRQSGALEYENLVDEGLMRRILWIALSERSVGISSHGNCAREGRRQ